MIDLEKYPNRWWKISPFFYTSVVGYRMFFLNKTKRDLYIHRIKQINRIDWKWKLRKILYAKKCSCGHPLWMHTCYEHGICDHGVCLAETFTLDEEVTCCCDGFNSMWNKEYPPNKPELRNTVGVQS